MTLFTRGDKSADKPVEVTRSDKPVETSLRPAAESIAAKPVEPQKPAAVSQPSPPPAKTGASMASVISKALKITGQLESTEDIQIDGEIEGDVRGVGVKIGQNAKVKGTVYGDEVELAGTIEGKIESKKVTLTGTARMTGDIVHQDIRIESGAYISGNLKPEFGKSEARPSLKPVASVQPAHANASAGGAAEAARH
ncbi:MAG TPA: polymer-forming cytoskeletal protein [Rhizomicrobium sp.]|jgi:cytoskeletal protein CcmA (bactofilin family)|nr:polymer-forming cytoskeletal protein [Rhizomicrobium sp.]